MPKENILPWQYFTRPFLSIDKQLDDNIKKIMEENQSELIDFRPYMNDNPMTVNIADSIHKCADVFRKMHLRHLCVIHPIGGKLEGIITR